MTASSDRALVACLVAWLIPGVARAAAPPSNAQADPDHDTARALYRDAVLLRREGKLQDALARIEAAYRTIKTPVIALELGEIDAQLGRLAAAYEVLRGVQAIPITPRESDKGRDARRDAATLAASLKERLATVRAAPPSVLDADVDVRLDGEPLDAPDYVRTVDPGAHAIAILVGGHACATSSFTVQEGELRVVDLRERAASCAPAPAKTAVAPRTVEAPARAQEAVEAPAPPREPVPVAEPTHTIKWIGLGVAGAGAVSLITGGVVALRAKTDYDGVAGACPRAGCSAYAYDVRQAAREHAIEATYAMAIGLLAIAGGVTLWVIDPTLDGSSNRRVGVAVSTTGVWMTVPLQ